MFGHRDPEIRGGPGGRLLNFRSASPNKLIGIKLLKARITREHGPGAPGETFAESVKWVSELEILFLWIHLRVIFNKI